MKNLFYYLLVSLFLFSQCIDSEFDEPPLNGENPDIPSELIVSIEDVLDQWVPGLPVQLNYPGQYVSGIITGDDNSGNVYKQIVFQDDSHGINVQADDVEMFNFFPEGTRIYVSLDSMWIGDFNGLPQLGFRPGSDGVSRIPQTLIREVITAGTFGNFVEPKEVKINELGTAALNSLVKLTNVQFDAGSIGLELADADNQFSINHNLVDCSGNMVVVRTSGFADFATDLVPGGGGTVTAIYSIFGDTKQLTIRRYTDLELDNERCSVSAITSPYEEGFDNVPSNVSLDLQGWTNQSTVGDDKWNGGIFDGNGYAVANAFQADSPDIETWLITPPIDVTAVSTLEFDSAQAFWNADNQFSVWVSTDFAGNAATATWQSVSANLPVEQDDFFEYKSSGDIDLTAYGSDEVYFGFKYVGNPDNMTTRIQVDVVRFKE